MDLKTYIADPKRKASLAIATGADPQWLWQIATRWKGKRASAELAVAIETATTGDVPRNELRPDIFGIKQERAA